MHTQKALKLPYNGKNVKKIKRFFARLLEKSSAFICSKSARKFCTFFWINAADEHSRPRLYYGILAPICEPLAGVRGTNPPNPLLAYAHVCKNICIAKHTTVASESWVLGVADEEQSLHPTIFKTYVRQPNWEKTTTGRRRVRPTPPSFTSSLCMQWCARPS